MFRNGLHGPALQQKDAAIDRCARRRLDLATQAWELPAKTWHIDRRLYVLLATRRLFACRLVWVADSGPLFQSSNTASRNCQRMVSADRLFCCFGCCNMLASRTAAAGPHVQLSAVYAEETDREESLKNEIAMICAYQIRFRSTVSCCCGPNVRLSSSRIRSPDRIH